MMHMQAAPGTSSRTGHALALSATVLGALWIAALAITAAAQRQDVSSWPLALALLAAAALTWLGLATRTIRPRPYVALLGIIGLAQLANSSAAGTAWSITSTVTLAALSAGLLLRPATAARRAIGILTITAAAVLTVVLGIRHAAGPYWAAAGAHVLHVLIDGLLATAVAQLLIEVADKREGLAARAAARHALAAGRQQARAERLRIGRLLHDTVANTLTVLRRPLTTEQEVAAFRRRCADDIEAIDAASAEADGQSADESSVDDLLARLARLVEQRKALGLSIHVRIDRVPGDGCDLPPATAEAFTALVGEALTNAAKHGAHQAWVEGEVEPVSLTLLVTDDGPGIPDQRTRTELAARYRRVYAEPGGIVSGLEPVDVGTRVSARWSAAAGVEHGLPAAVLQAVGADPDLDHLRLRMRLVVACVLALAAADLSLAYAIDERLQVTPTLLIYGALLVVLGLLRHLIARAGAEAAIDQREREREAVAEARAREQVRIRAEYLRDAVQVSRPLLLAMADGSADPRSAAVRARAAVAELYVRALLTLAPLAMGSPLAATMARWAGEAQEAGVQLAVAWSDERGGTDADGRDRDRGRGGEPQPSALAWMAPTIGALLRSSAGAAGQLTAFLDDGGGEITLVGEQSTGWCDPGLRTSSAPPIDLQVRAGVHDGWLAMSVSWRGRRPTRTSGHTSG